MSEVTVRTNSPVLGYARGETPRVEETDYIKTLVAAGRLTVVATHEDDTPKRRRRNAEKDEDADAGGGE